jgi:ubiquitin-protein ligase
MLYLEMPENFPAFPPKGRLVTACFHPNINRHGRICHSIFDRDWTTDTTLKDVLDTVYGLLLQAEAGDAV